MTVFLIKEIRKDFHKHSPFSILHSPFSIQIACNISDLTEPQNVDSFPSIL